jgi:hypothetical protein
MDVADQVARDEEIHVAHMQGRRARSSDEAPDSCPHDEGALATAWVQGYDERDRELGGGR